MYQAIKNNYEDFNKREKKIIDANIVKFKTNINDFENDQQKTLINLLRKNTSLDLLKKDFDTYDKKYKEDLSNFNSELNKTINQYEDALDVTKNIDLLQ